MPPPEPVTATTKAPEFQRGDTATFEDRDGRTITGVVVRINQRTATIGMGDGSTWRVPFHMLRHVLDICAAVKRASGPSLRINPTRTHTRLNAGARRCRNPLHPSNSRSATSSLKTRSWL